MRDTTEFQKIVGQVSAMAMMDADFKARLMADPESVLREHGLDVQAEAPDAKVEVLESYDQLPAEQSDTLYLVVPSSEELSHEDLSMVVGAVASCNSTASSATTIPSCVSSVSSKSTNSCS